MRWALLRKFRIRGAKTLEHQEPCQAMAKASLRESWRLAASIGTEPMSDEAIDREVRATRSARQWKAE